VVTHTLPLKDFKKGFDLMKKGDNSIKTILIP
jgi:erythritol/L-threitol dehydrogenase